MTYTSLVNVSFGTIGADQVILSSDAFISRAMLRRCMKSRIRKWFKFSASPKHMIYPKGMDITLDHVTERQCKNQ